MNLSSGESSENSFGGMDDLSSLPNFRSFGRSLSLASIDEEDTLTCSLSPQQQQFSNSPPVCVGRAHEQALLLKAFHAISKNGARSRVVHVHGESGTGKTSTCRSALRDLVMLQTKGFFVEGKWDQVVTNAPFTGIVEALSDICDLVEQSDEFETEHRPRILSKMKDDDASAKLIPTIARLLPRPLLFGDETVGNSVSESDDGLMSSSPTTGDSNLIADAFRTFVRALSSPTNPMVILFDDVQWANKGSLDLIEALTTDPESENVLYLLVGRDKDPAHCVHEDLVESIHRSLTAGPNVVDVHLQNLDLGSVHQLICWSLDMPPSKDSKELAGVVVDKTLANPLRVIQFLCTLRSQNFLQMNESGMWTWEIEEIMNQTGVSDDVAEQINDHLSRFDESTQATLTVASFLGFNFELSTLVAVVKHITTFSSKKSNESFDSDHVICVVDRACRERLVQPLFGKAGWFKFSHDSVQRCLYEAVSNEKEKALLHLQIGNFLTSSTTEPSIFEVSDHLNRGLQCPALRLGLCDLRTLAETNLVAATRALGSLDFSSASHYGSRALESIHRGSSAW